MQLGTHLDALCHLRMGDAGYDGFTLADSTPAGVTRLGIETVPADRHARLARRRRPAAGRATSSGSTT